ncbi:hypothetical protein ACFQX6_18770 [Streptosporangium lutulentum]
MTKSSTCGNMETAPCTRAVSTARVDSLSAWASSPSSRLAAPAHASTDGLCTESASSTTRRSGSAASR